MTSHKEGPQRFGRFIKKDDRILKSIALEEFSFEDISETKLTNFDNPEKSIIHVRLHDSEDLKDSVKEPNRINESLVDPTTLRSVIHPMDFTADWRSTRSQMGRRSSKDDDDDLDFATPGTESSPAAVGSSTATASGMAATTASGSNDRKLSESDVGGFRIDRGSEVAAQPESLEQLKPTPQSFDPGNVALAAATVAKQERIAHDQQRTSPSAAPTEFIPIGGAAVAHAEGQDIAAAAEQGAVDEYKARLAVQKANEKALEQLKAEARAEGQALGYRDGFQHGEEKAEIQARQNAAAMFGKLSDLVLEFERLKTGVLENVEANFYDLCQAMAEALLRREFDIHPQAFSDVLRKAIAETVGQDSFKIKLHPETFEKIAKLDALDITAHLQRDASVPAGDFRIESHLSIVESGARKLISSLLDQVDAGLFGETREKKGRAS